MFMVKLPYSTLEKVNKGSVVNSDLGKDVVNGLANVNLQTAFLMNKSGMLDKYGMFKPRNLGGLLSNDQVNKSSINSGNSSYVVSQAPVAPQTVDYLNADLAKHYGLGASTAYQEALSNTAYQRAVKDMKAAGLNPAAIFGAGKGYTAGGVSYVEPSSMGRCSGADWSYSGSRAGSSSGKLFSEGAYHAISTAVGLAGMAVMKKGPIGYYIAETAAKSVMGALNEIFR